ncbi:nicotinamidase [Novacetimonas maltaceti]|uniref:nicotinamidase n=1 Tax=Novacetimonas maltaceti TaxID=1203393 RepID=A0A2S3W4Q4_9PROT|nr:isochorismatase family protein [Novacetimonas maltaceti]POF63840.1 nicotinamidase/pyrazinamidase [Novacetimonas maltaceti]PYD61821.1 nicotinamidase [Novacetimonas maltaceti]
MSTAPAIDGRDALLIVDVQNDFLPGGALGVAQGARIIPVINRLQDLPFGRIVATQDWHPRGHVSFMADGMPAPDRWPEHCVAATWGAAFPDALAQARIGLVLRKGMLPGIDSYSAFHDNDGGHDSGLAPWLSACGIRRVFVCGIALDYCVRASALDAAAAGFDTFVLDDACAAINDDRRDAHRALHDGGIGIIATRDLVEGNEAP